MVVQVKEFEFDCNTATAAQTIASGLGFTPTGYILFSFQSTTDATFANHTNVVMGFSDGTTSCCLGMGSEDAVASSDAGFHHSPSAVIRFASQTVPDATEDARATHSSFGSGTIAINWSNLPAAAYRVYGIAFGGDISCEVKQFTTGRSTPGNQSYTTTMSTPQCVFLLPTTTTTATEQITNHGEFNFGIALSSSKRACISIVSEDGRATMDTWRLLDDTKCLTTLDPSSGGIDAVADFVSFDANGFTLNYTDQPSSSTAVFYAMVLKGANFDMGTVAKRTSTGDTVVNPSSVGTIKGVLVFSDNTTKSATVQAHNRISLGIGSSSTDKGGGWTGDTDNAADAVTAKRAEDSNILIMATENATPASSTLEALANLSATGTNTFTLAYSTATSLTADIVWWVVGESNAQNFNGNITEGSVSVSEALARTLNAVRTPSESAISVDQTLARVLSAIRSISESAITVDQTLTGIRLVPRSINETAISISDAIARVLQAVRSPADTTEISEALARIQSITKTISEPSVSINDALARTQIIVRTISEAAISINQTLDRILQAVRSPSEATVNINDALARIQSIVRTISEPSISINDTLARIQSIIKTISETAITVNQSLTRLRTVPRSISEPEISIDQTLQALKIIIKSISEPAISVDDAVARVAQFVRSIEQTVGVDEALTRIAQIFKTINETAVNVNQTLTGVKLVLKTISEPEITIDDTLTRIAQMIRTISEPSISIDDTVVAIKSFLRSITEGAINVNDSVIRILNAVRTPSEDAVTINGVVERFAQIFKTITEPSITLDDVVSGIKQALRTISEPSIGTNDTIVRILNAIRSPSEGAVSINDTLVRIQNIIKSIPESVDVDATVTGLRYVLRSVAEAHIKWYYSLLTYKTSGGG